MSQFQQPPFQPLNQPPQYPQQQPYMSGMYQQPPMTPPPAPTRKPKRTWKPWQLALVWFIAGISIGYAVHTQPSPSTTATQSPTAQATTAPSAAPTPKPAAPPKWTTVQTYKGTGSKKTGTFTAPNDWRILWTCNPASFDIPYNVIIEVGNAASGSTLDLPVNTTCKAGNTSDTSEEHQGGSVFLNVTSEGDWTIQVQELK